MPMTWPDWSVHTGKLCRLSSINSQLLQSLFNFLKKKNPWTTIMEQDTYHRPQQFRTIFTYFSTRSGQICTTLQYSPGFVFIAVGAFSTFGSPHQIIPIQFIIIPQSYIFRYSLYLAAPDIRYKVLEVFQLWAMSSNTKQFCVQVSWVENLYKNTSEGLEASQWAWSFYFPKIYAFFYGFFFVQVLSLVIQPGLFTEAISSQNYDGLHYYCSNRFLQAIDLLAEISFFVLLENQFREIVICQRWLETQTNFYPSSLLFASSLSFSQ